MEIIIQNIINWLSSPTNLALISALGLSLWKVIYNFLVNKDWNKAIQIAIEESAKLLIGSQLSNSDKKKLVMEKVRVGVKSKKLSQRDISDIVEIAYRSRVLNKNNFNIEK